MESAVARDDGSIHLSEEARAFLRIEAAALSSDVSALHAPARIAYRDGSIAEVGTPVDGLIDAVHVRVGETVAAGDPLVTLRSPSAASARAELSASRTALRHALEEARRTSDMLERGVSTERERREAELRVAELEIQVARVETQVSILGRGRGSSVVLRAPIGGTVLARRASIGMMVEPEVSESLVTIGDPSALGVVADVFDRDAALVRVGAAAHVTVPSIEAPIAGHVTYVAPVVTSGLRTVEVRIEPDVPADGLRTGLFGRASITLVDAGIVLPSSAVLIEDGDHTIVYAEIEPGTFTPRDVSVGPSVDGHVYVTSGVSVGDRIVVGGALLLDGAADQLL